MNKKFLVQYMPSKMSNTKGALTQYKRLVQQKMLQTSECSL